MRRRRSSVASAAACAVAAGLLLLAPPAGAQAEEGALFVLLPIGARSVATGQAVVAAQLGSEAVWWNPSALARANKREAAIHHSQTILYTGDALTLLVPSSVLGVAALSINIFDYGAQERTVNADGSTGQLLPRDVTYAATYGAPIGARVNAGLTYKILQVRLDCSGDCGPIQPSSSTTALDFGLQYDFTGLLPITLGASLRNLGLRLQLNDENQADPLPTRLHVGALYRIAELGSAVRPLDLHLSGDVVNDFRNRPTTRFGADLSMQKVVHLRAGYDLENAETSGPAIGVGLVAGSLIVDVARIFEKFSSGAGQAPMYLSLRYLF